MLESTNSIDHQTPAEDCPVLPHVAMAQGDGLAAADVQAAPVDPATALVTQMYALEVTKDRYVRIFSIFFFTSRSLYVVPSLAMLNPRKALHEKARLLLEGPASLVETPKSRSGSLCPQTTSRDT